MSEGPTISSDKLVDLWMHQNQLAWSRVRTAVAFQVVLIAGWYYSMTDDLPEVSAPLAILGLLLTTGFMILAGADLKARGELRDSLAERGAPLPGSSGKRGGKAVVILIVALLVAGNGLLCFVSLHAPHSMAAPADDSGSQNTSHRVAAR